jgi:hypothetical protein
MEAGNCSPAAPARPAQDIGNRIGMDTLKSGS